MSTVLVLPLLLCPGMTMLIAMTAPAVICSVEDEDVGEDERIMRNRSIQQRNLAYNTLAL
jgi:hypothetical protein